MSCASIPLSLSPESFQAVFMKRIFLFSFLALTLPAAAADQSAREFQECPQCPQMLGIPAGRFVMGSPVGEPGRFDSEGPQHVVSVQAFALAKYDVTSAEFLAFLRATGYRPAPCNATLGLRWSVPGHGLAYAPHDQEPPRWPAVCLDWKDAQAYIGWINAQARSNNPNLKRDPYRLPSEAEWEYAARGGTTTSRWWGESIGINNANCNGCGSPFDSKLLAPVDAFSPNPFGLYGMLGNAWQWVADCWHASYQGAPADARAWMSGDCTKHVLRGGSWDNVPLFVRAASRNGVPNDDSDITNVSDYSSLAGFRLARDLP
jgi:formylglycine-generating enzyme required for sulfatase activity